MRPLLVAAVMTVSAFASAQPLTVEDAVNRALSNNAQVQAARSRKEAAEDQARSARGQLLPSISLNDDFQYYNSPFVAQLNIPGAPVAAGLTVRDQATNTFSATAKQPLVGLFKLSQDFVAANANAGAASEQALNTERSMREAIETRYLRLFEARAAREVAKSSQTQLAEQLEVSKARVEAGAMTTADVLRVQVARANIQQQELQAGVSESAARTQLLVLLSLPLDADVDFAEPVALEAEAEKPAPELGEATTAAAEQRADLKQQLHLLDASDATARARLASLLPDVDLVGAYIRVDGQALAQQNAAYVGIHASWPIWLWGAQWYQHRAAVQQASAARALAEDASRQVKGEVSGRLDQLRAATSAIDVAKTALQSAEEAYRVTTAVVQAGSGTTTDLLDAQSALTQAKLNLVRSKYQQAMARVQLRRAMGG